MLAPFRVVLATNPNLGSILKTLPDIESLRCFIEAANHLNFRAAARVVGITPAALGQRIRKLEAEFEQSLFERNTRKVIITEAGLALLPVALKTVEAANECIRAASGNLEPVPIDMTIGTRHELGLSWIVPMLPTLEETFPGVTFHLYFGSGQDLERQVHSGAIDCAVSSRRITDPKFNAFRLHPEDYVFVGSKELLDRQPIELHVDTASHVILDTGADLSLFRYWRDAPGGSDSLNFLRLRELGTIAAIKSLVLNGQGIAVLPLYLVQKELDDGALRVILPEIKPLNDYFKLIYRNDDRRQALYQTLASLMATIPLRA
jgi:LysR family transcriptional regulator, glycine cleavage system transcriptional activator